MPLNQINNLIKMKKTLLFSLLVLAVAFTNNVLAQKEVDLQLILVSPTDSQQVSYDSTFELSYRIINLGDSAIEATDTIIIRYTALGITLPDTLTGVQINSLDTSDAVDVIELTHNFNLSSDSAITVCAYIDATLNNTALYINDTIQTNDTACAVVILGEKPNSIVSNTLAEQISVYPNPTKGNVKVDIKGLQAQNVQISVLDVTGRVIMTEKATVNTNANIELNTQNLSNGIYFISLQSNGQKAIAKFIKQ